MKITFKRVIMNDRKHIIMDSDSRRSLAWALAENATDPYNWILSYDFATGFHATDFPLKQKIARCAKVFVSIGTDKFTLKAW